MCGRYTLTDVNGRRIAQRWEFDERGIDPDTLGRFNVCPTESVLAVTSADGEAREARVLRWGLVPRSAAAVGKGAQPINVRSETALHNRWFGSLLGRGSRRCLIPADGWYEWLKPEHPKGARVPFRYEVDGGAPFAFAGVWSEVTVGGADVASAALFTTTANAVCAPVHNRMPVILTGPEAEAAWLSGEVDGEAAAELLAPLVAERTTAAPANPRVNRAGVEGPELLVAPPQGSGEPEQLRLA